MMSRTVDQLLRIAAWLSQGVNCILLGGHHDQTVSARCYANRHKWGWRTAYKVLNWVFGLLLRQANHCRSSFYEDAKFAKQVIDLIE